MRISCLIAVATLVLAGIANAREITVNNVPPKTISDEPKNDSDQSPPRIVSAAETTAREFDPNAPPDTTIIIAPYLSFGGNIKLKDETKDNRDLNKAKADNKSILEPELSLALSFSPDKQFYSLLNFKVSKNIIMAGHSENKPPQFEISQAYMSIKNITGSLKIVLGKERFNDKRTWLYDKEMYTARILWKFFDVLWDASVTRNEIVDRGHEPEESEANAEKGAVNYMLYGQLPVDGMNNIAVYGFIRKNNSAKTINEPRFLGLQCYGEPSRLIKYWTDAAHVSGTNASKKINGFGVDTGFTLKPKWLLRPSLTFGYAFGSGDSNSNDELDENFRQTGLQDNSDKFGGVVRLKYYGELFDPELSNMSIATAGIGARPSKNTSVDFMYHHYLQDKLSKKIRDSDIKMKPDGKNKKLGSELDLVAGSRKIYNLDTKLVLGCFIPGAAFPQATKNALLIELELRYNF